MSEIQALRVKLEGLLGSLGMTLEEIYVQPTDEGEDVVRLRVKVSPEILRSDSEHELDQSFEDIIKELKE